MSLKIPFTSQGFPAHILSNNSQELSTTWDDIIWSSVTIGRPSIYHVFQHNQVSWYEAIFRIALVRMALEQYGPHAKRLRRTDTFKKLDPTEKSSINYFLGMTFCKLFASSKLDTPWILHLDVFGKSYAAAILKGRSRPDLFGQRSKTGEWIAFETKGRATKPSQADKNKAKIQSQRLKSVGGHSCLLHVGSFSYFVGDAVQFFWIDPPSETLNPIDLPEIGDEWEYYYGPIRSLWLDKPNSQFLQRDIPSIYLSESDLEIHIYPKLAYLLRNREWSRAQRTMFENRESVLAAGFKADGLKFVCGPSWHRRAGEILQSI